MIAYIRRQSLLSANQSTDADLEHPLQNQRVQRVFKSFQAVGDVLDFKWQLPLKANLVLAVDDAQRTRLKRYI